MRCGTVARAPVRKERTVDRIAQHGVCRRSPHAGPPPPGGTGRTVSQQASAWWAVALTVGLVAGWLALGRIPGRVQRVRVQRVRVRQSLVVAALVAAAVYPLQVPKDYNFFFGDEGIVIAVAQRMAEGAVLYRDVWEFLQPGSFTLLALVFRVFGSGVTVLDGCALVLFAANAFLLHRLVAHLVSPRGAWLTVAAFVLVLAPIGVWLSPHWMSTGAAMAALLCLLRDAPPAPRVRLLGAGLCIGLTFLFQQHKGVFLAGTLGSMYLVVCLLRGAGPRRTAQACGWIVAGAGCAALPLVVWLSARGLWGDWWYATFTWVLEGYGPANATRPELLPLQPGLSPMQLVRGFWYAADLTLLYVAPVAFLIVPVTWVWRGGGGTRWQTALVWAAAVGAFGTVLTRYEFLRLLYTAPLTLALAAVGLERLRAGLPMARRGVAHFARLVAFGAAVCVLCVATARQYARHVRQVGAGQHRTLDTPQGRVRLWSSGFGTLAHAHAIIAALQAVPRDSGLFVYPSGAGYGYLSGLRNPTPYHFVLPGYTRDAQWERLRRLMADGRVQYVVWELNLNPQWMRDVYPTLPPDSVWDHAFPRSLDGPGWRRILETPTVRLYQRTAASPEAPAPRGP